MKNKNNNKNIRSRVRAEVSRQGAIKALSALRSKLSPSSYAELIASFKSIAAIDANRLFRLGPIEFRRLIGGYQPLSPLSLRNELLWANAWLKGQSHKINDFHYFSNKLQSDLLEKGIAKAITKLECFCDEYGWSVWAVELRLAMEKEEKGTDGLKSLSSKWREITPNSALGLLIQIITDRNDSSLSYETFYWKCFNSFPRFSNHEGLSEYLMFRSLSYLHNTEDDFPLILSREITSSLIDYYESIIEILISISTDTSGKLKSFEENALNLIDALIKDGFNDGRLVTIRMALTGQVPDTISPDNESVFLSVLSNACVSHIDWSEHIPSCPVFLEDVLKDLKQVCEKGYVAQKSFSRIIKLGLNFKSLDIGMLIALSQKVYTSKIQHECLLPLEMTFTSQNWYSNAMLLKDDDLIKYIELIAEEEKEPGIIDVIHGESITSLEIKPLLLYLWLGRWLVKAERWKDTKLLCNKLSKYGYYWQRQSEKIRLTALVKEEKIVEALTLGAQWLLKNPIYGNEFPVENIFANRGWRDFSNLDLILVGLVAHHTFVATEISDIHYICKMSCRAIAMSGGIEQFSDSNPDKILIAFLRDVWIAENLVMNHLLETTEDVQQERMKVMQLLMQHDQSNEMDYVASIKELTFDQTIRSGLKHIDQTRIFVNEGAIIRWAEKELMKEYERWIELLRSDSYFSSNDDFIRKYLVAPQSVSLYQELGKGNPIEANALLTTIIERLFERFVMDSNDGLDSYLSLRIRHGSLRGKILGPMEENKLLYSETEFSHITFGEDWNNDGSLSEQDCKLIFNVLEKFSLSLQNIVGELINEKVQVYSDKKPLGGIPYSIPITKNSKIFKIFRTLLSEQEIAFDTLLINCFYIFWKAIEPYLEKIGEYIKEETKVKIQNEFDTVVENLRKTNVDTKRIETALHTVATQTQLQCDTVSAWFRLPSQDDSGVKYSLINAIEISKETTNNIYRSFPIDILMEEDDKKDILLSIPGLSVISDCLFIIFENAWKHSGLHTSIGTINLSTSFDKENLYFSLTVTSNLSKTVITELKNGKLETIRKRYTSQDHSKMLCKEGGSGFAKLTRLTRTIDRTIMLRPLQFEIINKKWVVNITIPLYEREGVYDAYE
ncbi:MAG: hypothetical protein HRT92_04865 [Piscirickettsiaceae bacterium]|nr:hypothetical protein [Piscirickettsiaceae bacterium]